MIAAMSAVPREMKSWLAPCASWRDQVVPAGDAATQVAACDPEAETDGPIGDFPNAYSRNALTGLGEDTPGVEISSAQDEPRIRAPAGAPRESTRAALHRKV
jgi:hypothetical protein